ncbi:exodeoxyribonuclease VII large subunit [Legionella sp. 16cNR16C]|uniref:exodeoxyribonuclease VII large subunit n=1 Tax=Legionella sp. 16cNR16C TaxID=2905656 RepID=UPI001E3C6EBE|nr:exodeoxyribonuclease VII large subunit [Legionella sp. 16cNR16C]MCE3044942.1 exodeoxyribonuclease VII large subunit [Legionella sp. 16cNR16C]
MYLLNNESKTINMRNDATPITVSHLNRQVRNWMEHELAEVRVLGELSNLSKPSSGHFYFTLKDEGAQVRCVYFRNAHNHYSKQFKDGQQVVAYGRLSLYEARGDYQLIVQDLVDAGIGELYQQFERLKAKLAAIGLFDTARKRILPRYPEVIAVVTSPTGAALRDIVSTLARRYPCATVLIYPTEVQGKTAAKQIIQAIQQANSHQKADVLILARGGGSIEDLWSFNDEELAHTIRSSLIPVISGIGHETDFTIADFAADFRAATPTAAAEAATPDRNELLTSLQMLRRHLGQSMSKALEQKKLRLAHQMRALASPKQLISSRWQSLDFAEKQLGQSFAYYLGKKGHAMAMLENKLKLANPITQISQSSGKLITLQLLLEEKIRFRLENARQAFIAQITKLDMISPLATLSRGYSISTQNDKVIYSSQEVEVGDMIRIQLNQGQLDCRITEKHNLQRAENA